MLVGLAELAVQIALAAGVVLLLARRGRAGLAIGTVLWVLTLLPCIGLVQYALQSIRQDGNPLDLLRPGEAWLALVMAAVPSFSMAALAWLQRRAATSARPPR